jgi:hypothetical protein
MPKRVNYAKIVGPDTFLGQYLLYNDSSETPLVYDFFTGLFILSNVVGRTTVVERGSASVFLNMYCILVAESGITRKSTSVRRATKILHKMGVFTIENKTTPEKLEYMLVAESREKGHCSAAICIDELVKFLGKEKYMDTMPGLLTDLYDCPDIRSGGGSFVRGDMRLDNVYLNFLSASTPSWLIRAVNPDVIEGGFTSRVLFVVSEKRKKCNPWPEKPDEELHTSIINHLERIKREASDIPKVAISKGGRSKFEAWYRRREVKRDPFRKSFQSREDGHILRVAALLCINDQTWEIQATHISAAIRIIEEVREDGALIFEGTGTHGRTISGIDNLRDMLLAAGMNGVTQAQLTKRVQAWINASTVRAALDVMHEMDMVQKFTGIQLGRGRPSTLYRATRYLIDSKSLEKVMERLEP